MTPVIMFKFSYLCNTFDYAEAVKHAIVYVYAASLFICLDKEFLYCLLYFRDALHVCISVISFII